MKKGKYILHKRSALVNPLNGEPMQISDKSVMHGEIVVGYASGHERLYIKNDNDDIVSFSSKNEIDAALDNKSNKIHKHSLSDIKEDVVDSGFFKREIERTGFIGYTIGTDYRYYLKGSNTAPSGEFVDADCSDVTSTNAMFFSQRNLISLDLSNFDTSNVTDMESMFDDCIGLISLDLSNFDTSKVTSMGDMFGGCNSLESIDISSFDTSNVTDMESMFSQCNSLESIDLSNFDTSKVTSMGNMFGRCNSLESIDISSFDTSNVTDMRSMFWSCTSLRDITLGENFFNTNQAIPFDGANNLGSNEDGSNNGWIEHLAAVAPQITDGQSRTITLSNNLKNKSWASPHIIALQAKGYTIA